MSMVAAVFVCPGTTGVDKFRGVVAAVPGVWRGSILDIGSRTGDFRTALAGTEARNYTAVDLGPPADVVADLELGLPMPNASFDTVVALDVLEHTNDIHTCFAEVCRVAKRHIVLSLPNMYLAELRVRILRGRQISGKYGLPVQRLRDRHRWFFSYSEAAEFCAALAQKHGFCPVASGALVGPKRAAPHVRWLVSRYPDLLAPTLIFAASRCGEYQPQSQVHASGLSTGSRSAGVQGGSA